MIKVLHFVSTPAIGSGVMSVIMNYYRHMDHSRIQFDFLCFLPSEASYVSEIEALGGHVEFINKPDLTYRSYRALEFFFKAHMFDYTWLHNHEVYFSAPLKYLAARYKIPHFIIHSHATKYSDRFWANIRNYIMCIPICFFRCERIACSRAAGLFLYHQHVLKKQTFFVLPNTVEKQIFQYKPPIRKKYRRELELEDDFVVGHIGRFVPQKNHEFLLELFKGIQKEYPKSKLLLVGEGPSKKAIISLAKKLQIENNVLFLGERKDVSELLQAMDIYVLPSIYEGLPISCLEAQAAGLPCLISGQISGEVIYGENVLTLELTNLRAWIKACLNICLQISEQTIISSRACPDSLPDIASEAAKLAQFYETGDCLFEKIYRGS